MAAQALRNYLAIALCAVAVLSHGQCHGINSRSLCNRLRIKAQSLNNHSTIAAQSLRDRYANALESLRNR
jgi:hypothetical protein